MLVFAVLLLTLTLCFFSGAISLRIYMRTWKLNIFVMRPDVYVTFLISSSLRIRNPSESTRQCLAKGRPFLRPQEHSHPVWQNSTIAPQVSLTEASHNWLMYGSLHGLYGWRLSSYRVLDPGGVGRGVSLPLDINWVGDGSPLISPRPVFKCLPAQWGLSCPF